MVCPESVYNLYKGFHAETLPEVPAEEVAELVAPILRHLDLLTSGDSHYFQAWQANIIQTPSEKSETAVVLRDESQLLKEGVARARTCS